MTALPLVDLFAGAGGLSAGLSAAGFDPIRAIEIDADACSAYSELHPQADVSNCAIEDVSLRHLRGEVSLLAAGPPCQPFSSGGKRLAADDPRDGFPQFLRKLDEVKPDCLLIENVAGLASPSARSYFEALLQELGARRFSITWTILNAADYGVPQKRRRLFIVGLRTGQFAFPTPTHGPGLRKSWSQSGAVVHVDQVLGEPNTSIVTYAKRPDVRPSPYDGHLFNGGGRPLDLAAPAPTILATAGGNKTPFVDTHGVVPEYHAHLREGGRPRRGKVPGARRLTVEECAALQTFPRGTKLFGPRSARYTHVGNAVPPALARRLGTALHAAVTRDAAPDLAA